MFLDECTYPSEYYVDHVEMYKVYCFWTEANALTVLNYNTFCKKMKEHKVETLRKNALGNRKVSKFVRISIEDNYSKLYEAWLEVEDTEGAECY